MVNLQNEHLLTLRVYYENTDAAGIVYHAEYLCFAERGRTEMLRDSGFEHAALKRETGIAFAVRSLNIDYISPAKLDDEISVKTKITSITGARMLMDQSLFRGEDLLVKLNLVLACINEQGKPVRMPEIVNKTFKEKIVR